MRRLLHRPLRKLSFLSSSTSGLLVASKRVFKSAPFPNPLTPSARRHPFHSRSLAFSPISWKPVSKIRPLCLLTNGYSSLSPAHVAEPVELEKPEENGMSSVQMRILKEKLENLGIDGETIFVPGQYNHLICPMVAIQRKRAYPWIFRKIGVVLFGVAFVENVGGQVARGPL